MHTEKIKELASKYLAKMVEYRRHLHQYPEVATEEYETQKYIEEALDAIGIPHQRMADTGVVGLIEGGMPGKTVLLRADIDALPIHEEADCSFKSTIDGKMHACGHDGHIANLLGSAHILFEMKEMLSGNVKLMFQPAEEMFGGAERMIEEGILENPKVDAAFGLHLWGSLPENRVETKPGSMMGAPDEFILKIIGRGGHAAIPQETIDPVVISAEIITGAQSIITRKVNPLTPAVISFCQVHTGTANNVIPEIVELSGTIRTLDTATRAMIPKLLKQFVKGVCDAHGATFTFEFKEYYPPVINDEAMSEHVFSAAKKILPASQVGLLSEPTMGGDDFAYLGYQVPACYYFYGIGQEEFTPVHHHPKFAWNDDLLENSSATLVQAAVDFLE